MNGNIEKYWFRTLNVFFHVKLRFGVGLYNVGTRYRASFGVGSNFVFPLVPMPHKS